MADKVIAVEVREIYGVPKAYPKNDAAKVLAEIAGTTTLTQRTLDLAKRLGFSVVDVSVSKIAAVA